jgi:hypothetical protein
MVFENREEKTARVHKPPRLAEKVSGRLFQEDLEAINLTSASSLNPVPGGRIMRIWWSARACQKITRKRGKGQGFNVNP